MPHSSHIPPSWHPHWQAAQVVVEFVDEDGDGNLNLSESFGAEFSPEVVHFHLQMCSSDFAGFSCSAWERDPQFQNPKRSQRDSKALKLWVSRRKLSWLVWCQWFDGQFSGKPGAMMHDATGNSTRGIFYDQDQHADRFLYVFDGFCLFVAAPLMILMGRRPQWEMSLSEFRSLGGLFSQVHGSH